MIYPYTALMHGIAAGLCIPSLLYLFYLRKRRKFHFLAPYSNWFLFLLFYNSLLVLPLLLLDRLTLATGIFYNFALFFLGIAMWQAFVVGLNLTIRDEFYRTLLPILYLVGVASAVTLHFLFPEIPRGSVDGKWVLWYSNPHISLFYTAFAFVAGWTFVIGCLYALTKFPSRMLRLRILCFALAGFILPFAAWFYFGAQNSQHVRVTFFFLTLGLILFIIANIFLAPKRIFSHSQKKSVSSRYLEVKEV